MRSCRLRPPGSMGSGSFDHLRFWVLPNMSTRKPKRWHIPTTEDVVIHKLSSEPDANSGRPGAVVFAPWAAESGSGEWEPLQIAKRCQPVRLDGRRLPFTSGAPAEQLASSRGLTDRLLTTPLLTIHFNRIPQISTPLLPKQVEGLAEVYRNLERILRIGEKRTGAVMAERIEFSLIHRLLNREVALE